MDTEPAAAAQAEAASVATVEPVASTEVVTREQIANAQIEGASPAVISKLEAAYEVQEAAGKAKAAAPQPEVAAEAEPEPDETPAAEAETEEEEETPPPAGEQPQDDKEPSARFRLKGEDQAIAILAKARQITIAEASDIVRGITPKAAEVQPEQVAQVAPEVAEIEQSIAAQRAELAKLRKDKVEYADEPQVFAKEIADLDARREEILENLAIAGGELAAAKLNAKHETEKRSERATAAEKQMETIVVDYPDMASTDSAQWMLARQISVKLKEANDPRWSDPRVLAEEAAKKLNLKPATAKPAAATPVAAKAAAKPGPAPGTRSAAPPEPKLTAAQAKAKLEEDTNAILMGQKPRSNGSNLIAGVHIR